MLSFLLIFGVHDFNCILAACKLGDHEVKAMERIDIVL